MQYRSEIDGLRAVAVTSVLLFHAGFSLFSGGYVGVDIFFVISGFLITSILLKEQESGTFSLKKFYERRARRILPALFFVMLCCIPFTFFIMNASQQLEFAKSLIYIPLFISNILFAKQTDYFAPKSEELPLLHTWSLAVEEQYYLLFPLILMIFWNKGRTFLLLFIALLSLISLFICQFGGNFIKQFPFITEWNWINPPTWGFYMITTRAWELLVGSLAAFITLYARQKKSEFLSITGFLMIVYSIISFNNQTPFPSFYALIPTIGSALIILYGTSGTFISRTLSLKFIVFLGLISYSTYLWHQPIFSFARLYSDTSLTSQQYFSLILLTFCLAYFTWRYIEKPFRNLQFLNQNRIFALSVTACSLFLVVGVSGKYFEAYQYFIPENIKLLNASATPSPMREACHTSGEDYLPTSSACKYFNTNTTWAVFGDSHAVEPAYALGELLDKKNEGVLHLSFSGCPPSVFSTSKTKGCTNWTKDALETIKSAHNIKNVIVAYRHSAYLFGENTTVYPTLPNEPLENFNSTDKEISRKLYWENFKYIIDELLASGKTVYVLLPIPELGSDIKKLITISNRSSPAVSLKYYEQRNEFILEKINTLKWSNKLRKIDTSAMLCKDQLCQGIVNNRAMYFDSNHLSIEGAKLVMSAVAE